MTRNAIILIIVLTLVLLMGRMVRKRITMTQSERLNALLPEVRSNLQRLRETLSAKGITTFVGRTGATEEQQESLVQSGKSGTRQSFHRLGRAVDLYIRDPTTNAVDFKGRNEDLYRTMHNLAPVFGFTGLAFNADGSKRFLRTKSGPIWDIGHLQYTSGMTFAQAAAQGPVQV